MITQNCTIRIIHFEIFKCFPLLRRVLDLFTRVKLCTAVSAPAAWRHLSWHWYCPGQKSTGTLLPFSLLADQISSRPKALATALLMRWRTVVDWTTMFWFLIPAIGSWSPASRFSWSKNNLVLIPDAGDDVQLQPKCLRGKWSSVDHSCVQLLDRWLKFLSGQISD